MAEHVYDFDSHEQALSEHSTTCVLPIGIGLVLSSWGLATCLSGVDGLGREAGRRLRPARVRILLVPSLPASGGVTLYYFFFIGQLGGRGAGLFIPIQYRTI